MYFRNCDFVRVAVRDVFSIWIGEIIIHITIQDTQQARCIGVLRDNDVKVQDPVCNTDIEAETWRIECELLVIPSVPLTHWPLGDLNKILDK